jgi:hypothetical protein
VNVDEELTLEELCAALVAIAAEPDTVWCNWLGCKERATYTVRTKRLAPKPYCVEHSHGVAYAKQAQGHEEIRRVPIEEV